MGRPSSQIRDCPILRPHLTFAIGDVHGELQLLASAFARIEARAGAVPFRIVMLGDYVDRGPDSAGVVRLLRERERQYDLVCLKGNHEDLMIRACDGGDPGLWLRNGGEETLRSYRGAVPPEDLAWLRALPVRFGDGRRIYVHGGLKPHVPLDEQDDEACMWIRTPFLEAPAGAFPAHVVHGHTPYWDGKPEPDEPELLAHRTNLDTYACETGRLAIGVFETQRPGGPVEVLRVSRPVTVRAG
ncbi:MAG: metallophosphoesterase [Candidatus Andeanibacterium colombiense]|uniref:Metallophosphoesterase n=1 Tax=Candidatus Andeanibacterium colombiense TaxID=3121345 RepID=A0AAJ6BMZ7_9SPHN|nr:MAG: metallophosphoesterase [Sphingomonadaceae bacterium]